MYVVEICMAASMDVDYFFVLNILNLRLKKIYRCCAQGVLAEKVRFIRSPNTHHGLNIY